MTHAEAVARLSAIFDRIVDDKLMRAETLLAEAGATVEETETALADYHRRLLKARRVALTELHPRLRDAWTH